MARFIGSPQVELLDVELTEEGMRCGEALLPITSRQRARLAKASAALSFAIRPEHVRLAKAGPSARVKDVQPIGPATLVTLEWNGGRLHARLNGIARLAAGSMVRIEIDTDRLMFFERDSGLRIEA